MGSHAVVESLHATFSTTVADLVTFTYPWQVVRIVNKDTVNTLYFRCDNTTSVAAEAGTHIARPGEAVVYASKAPIKYVSLVGSGGDYSIEGFPGFGSSASSAGGGGTVTSTESQVIADDAAFTPATSKVFMAGFEADETAADSVDEGDAGAARMTLDRKQIMLNRGHASGGLTIGNNIDVDESEDDIKTTAGTIYTIYAYNNAASTRYLRFYNATAANTTVGTTATALGPFGIPAGGGFVWSNDIGVSFDTAFCVAATTGVAAADTGAPGANDVVITVGYV